MILTVTLNTSIDKFYLVDKLESHTVMRVKEVRNTAGGKGLNVSRVAALSGERVTAMGFVGGYNGSYLESLLDNTKIVNAFTHVEGETRCCINVYDEKTNKSTEFLEPGFYVKNDDVEIFFSEFENMLPNVDVVTISGSAPRGMSPNHYVRLIEMCHAAGKKVLVDLSGENLQASLSAKPTLIKPNRDEIRQIMDVDVDDDKELINAAGALYDTGIKIVAVSLGKRGVFVVCDEGVFHGITPDIDVVSAVGSGDSMIAGFAVGLARNYPIEQTICYAVAVSTANAMTKDTGYFTQENLDYVMPLVRVEKI